MNFSALFKNTEITFGTGRDSNIFLQMQPECKTIIFHHLKNCSRNCFYCDMWPLVWEGRWSWTSGLAKNRRMSEVSLPNCVFVQTLATKVSKHSIRSQCDSGYSQKVLTVNTITNITATSIDYKEEEPSRSYFKWTMNMLWKYLDFRLSRFNRPLLGFYWLTESIRS